MKNKFILALVSLFVLASCGGGGGSAPLVISVTPFSSLSVNEDDTYETILTATANQPANISFSISSQPSNAYASITNSGELTYQPLSNYFGSDNFVITVSATRESDPSSILRKTLSVRVTVNPVNDPPEIVVNDDLSTFDENVLIFDDSFRVNVSISDIDNNLNQLNVFGLIEGQSLSGIFTK